jgi:hypothetical protein
MYTAEINRRQPACLLLLIDQSGSMAARWASAGMSKADQLALAVNRLLHNAVLLCTKGDDQIHDYFDVGILGYGAVPEGVGPALHGTSAARPLLPISELAYDPMRVDHVMQKVPDGNGGIIEASMPSPVFVDPMTGQYGTPMAKALQYAEQVVSAWCETHTASFPPLVINITDGESTDGDPRDAAEGVRSTGTADGASLLFNVHISALQKEQIIFPNSAAGLPDRYASTLYEMSSPLPPPMSTAASRSFHVESGARGFIYNADATTTIEFLDIGTRAVTPTGLKELTAGPSSMM